MKRAQLAMILLLVLATSSCERSEREMQREREDVGRTGDTPPPRAENAQPTAAPKATDTAVRPGQETVGAREQIPLAKDREAEAEIKAAKGQKLSGDAELKEMAGGLHITIAVKDAPAGMKAVHIYDRGDCSNIEAASTGKHFAPKGERHGVPGSSEHHPGDLGNITIADNGEGRLEIMVKGANLKEKDPMSVLGKTIVISSAKDTGAEGSAGKPIACGVIEKE